MPLDVLGKEEDEAPTALATWHERTMPFVDLTRHMLLLSHVTGLRSGCIFANVENLKKCATNDNITHNDEHTTYEHFLKDFKHCVRLVTYRECKIGLHSLRNTAYLCAMFANGVREDMRKSARHKKHASFTRYEQDMTTLLEMIRRSGSRENSMLQLVPKWNSIFIQNDNQGALVHVINSNNNNNTFISLNHHAGHYFKNLVKNESRQLHVVYKNVLECGNQKQPMTD